MRSTSEIKSDNPHCKHLVGATYEYTARTFAYETALGKMGALIVDSRPKMLKE